ncbi:MAG: hypothetical protein ICV64_09535 [Thermoleophilia bacterium]|nr:hypothetical protein [Thermoleophilia bacterium]
MLPRFLLRRLGPAGVALTAYDIWRRLPPQHRRRLLEEGRRHAPTVAAQGRDLLERGRRVRARRRGGGGGSA